MNRVIKADDVDFMGVEVAALVKKCPDMTSDMLYALLALRGDISKADYKDVSFHLVHPVTFGPTGCI